jgi:hypothetical protein
VVREKRWGINKDKAEVRTFLAYRGMVGDGLPDGQLVVIDQHYQREDQGPESPRFIVDSSPSVFIAADLEAINPKGGSIEDSNVLLSSPGGD